MRGGLSGLFERPLLGCVQHPEDGYLARVLSINDQVIRPDHHFPRAGDAAGPVALRVFG